MEWITKDREFLTLVYAWFPLFFHVRLRRIVLEILCRRQVHFSCLEGPLSCRYSGYLEIDVAQMQSAVGLSESMYMEMPWFDTFYVFHGFSPCRGKYSSLSPLRYDIATKKIARGLTT